MGDYTRMRESDIEVPGFHVVNVLPEHSSLTSQGCVGERALLTVRSLPSDREVVPPTPPNRKVAAPGRETDSIARSPAPDREVTDRDGRSFSGEPWGRLLSSRSEPPTGAVLLELWGHAGSVSGRVALAASKPVACEFLMSDHCTLARGSALACDCNGWRVRRRTDAEAGATLVLKSVCLADHVVVSSSLPTLSSRLSLRA